MPSSKEVSFDDWLHDKLVSAYEMENETWATDKVGRVIRKLNAVRRRKPRLKVVVLGIKAPTAFTSPGKYLYISRRLLERLATDDEVALVLAHEAAHHDLGHLDEFSGWAARIPRVGGSWVIATAFRAVEQRMYSHDFEFAADRRGMELCLKAKFDGAKCLGLFSILKQFALDYGDLDGVFGSDFEGDVELAANPMDWLFLKTRAALAKIPTGRHPALLDRVDALKKQLGEIAGKKAKPRATKKATPRVKKPLNF